MRGLKELLQKVPQDPEFQKGLLFRFSTAKGNIALKKAILRHTDIEDSQVAYLENAVNLERLSLASTNITNESLQYLEQLKYLTWLDLSKTNITKEAKDKLQKVLPNTKIDFFK